MNKTAATCLLAMAFHCGAHAGTAGLGTPATPYAMLNGVLLVPTDGARANVPACATESARFAINGTTAAGKVQVATMLMAIAMGKKIYVWGTGTCSVWADTETIDFFQIAP